MINLLDTYNYRVAIDSFGVAPEDSSSFEIRGWAVDSFRHDTLAIDSSDTDVRVRRFSREDICTVHKIKSGIKVAFILTFPKHTRSIPLTIHTPGSDIESTVDVAKVRDHFLLEKAKVVGERAGRGVKLAVQPSRWSKLVDRVAYYSGIRKDFYTKWCEKYETLTKIQAENGTAQMKVRPKFSIVTPVYNVDEKWLREFIESVRSQWYTNWELCIADDCSSAEHVRKVLEEYASADSRIKVFFREKNGGISEATNSAMALATGDFIGFMDNDDILAPQALFRMAQAINQNEMVDFLYSDEDKINERGERFDPFFKPGFSPQLLRGHNYITHFVVVRKTVVDKIGNFRAEFSGSQDYDFVLRATQVSRTVVHVPEMLYHWRTLTTSVAGDPYSKYYAYEAGRKALQETFDREGINAQVSMLKHLGTYGVSYNPGNAKVLVVYSDLTNEQVEELKSTTQYSNVEYVENTHTHAIEEALEKTHADYIVLVSGVLPHKSTWVKDLLSVTWQKQVAAVSGMVIDKQSRVEMAGVSLKSLKDGKPFDGAGEFSDDTGYYFRVALPREIFSSTEQILLVNSKAYKSVGFINDDLPRGLRGIDLCARINADGLGNTIFNPLVQAVNQNDQPLEISKNDIKNYVENHSGKFRDIFSPAAIVPKDPDDHPVVIAIDDVKEVAENTFAVTGWSADIHFKNAAEIYLDAKSFDNTEILDITRVVRPDVASFHGMNKETELGFIVTVKTTSSSFTLVGSTEHGEDTVKVNVSAVNRALKRSRRYLKMAKHPRSFAKRVNRKLFGEAQKKQAYDKFLKNVEAKQPSSTVLIDENSPLISIVVPVYNVEEKWLRKCVDSIKNQTYTKWELCLADDYSPSAHVRPLIESILKEDKRIKAVFREENGHISKATNSALEIATGDFIALMDNDDELPNNALMEVARVIVDHPDVDLIYSDEDKIDENGKRSDPAFKPDYSPDLLMSTNYISHLGVYRASIMKELGGFRSEFDGSQDYDLVLRFVEKTAPEHIHHIPRVLYHWRMLPTSTAGNQSAKDYAFVAGLKAVQAALDRRGIKATARRSFLNGIYDIDYDIASHDMVSVIIPTKDGYDNIERSVSSILEKTTYDNYEIVIADNGSTNPAMQTLYTELGQKASELGKKLHVLDIDIPFNFSRINNLAAKEAEGKYLLFLNDDTEVIAPNWMTTMISWSQQERVGIVGAKLYYPKEVIQHAGVVLGLGGVAGHVFAGAPRTDIGQYGRLMENTNYYALTAACFMLRADDFWAVNGFDETFDVAYNDVDICIRVHDQLGRDNVWVHEAELYHYESITRGHDAASQKKMERLMRESERMRKLYAEIIDNDPYYNPNLSRTDAQLTPRVS